MRYGLARGLYANEAGYGTAAVAYATAQSARPVQQGLNAVMETFIVSFVTSTITAMTILLSGAMDLSGQTSTAASRDRLQRGHSGGHRRLHRRVLRVSLWLHHAHRLGVLRRAVPEVLARSKDRDAVPLGLLPADPLGALTRVEVVWAWGDLMNALQIFPNIIGVLGLSGVAARVARERL